MMKKSILLIVFILPVLGCKKEDEKPNSLPYYEISSGLRPFLFTSGSYWVYNREIVPGQDSVYVLSIVEDTLAIGPSGPGQGYSGYKKFYSIQYHSSFTNQTFEEALIGYVISKGHGTGGFVLLTSKTIGDKSLNAEIIDIIDTLTIESKTYKEVIKMKILADQYISQNYYLYYTDTIGLIKKELIVNNVVTETWNLSTFNTILLEPQ